MAPDTVERKLAAILSADIVGYSRLMAEDEEATIRTLRAYRDQVGALVREHRGRLADFSGDNFLAEFPTALDAVECAIEIQRVLGARNAGLPAERRMEFRIGAHMGDVRVEGERIFGDGVNIAARLEGLADPGRICISATVHEQVRNKLGVGYQDLGDRTVKNIPDQVHVYQVQIENWDAQPSTGPALARRRPYTAIVVGAAALLLLLLFAGWQLLGPSASSLPAPGSIRSIAVLPLDNLSGDPAQEYFADGMTDAMISSLARIGSLRVISRTSVMQFKGARKPLPEIARELGVDAVLEGSFAREGERVRITVQLIDARSDSHLWTEHYERELAGVLALQSEVARAVAEQIELELTPSEQRQLASTRPMRPDAYEAYLKGLHSWNKRNAAGFDEAIAHFQLAIELDPEAALGYAGLALTYDQQGVLGIIPPREAARLIRGQVTRALELDDSLGEAHVSQGDLHWWMWNWPGVEREYRRALELNPSSVMAYNWLAYYLVATGRQVEGLVAVERALEFDPVSAATRTDAARLHFFARDYDKAVEFGRAALRIDGNHADAYALLSAVYSTQGRDRDAVNAGRKAVDLSEGADGETAWLGYSLARAGQTDEATELFDELVSRSQQRHVDPVIITRVLAGLGDRDELFRWLEKAYDVGSLWLSFVNVSPAYDGVRDDPRFRDVIRRMGLPQG